MNFIKTKTGIVNKKYAKKSGKDTWQRLKPKISKFADFSKANKFSVNLLNKNLTKKETSKLNCMIKSYEMGFDSKNKYSNGGEYTTKRQKIHKKLIKQTIRGYKKDKDPDVYFFGGVGGSGKGTVLRPLVKEKAITIDSDDYKQKLSKYDKSPLKRFGLAHAGFLHEESSDLADKTRDIAIKNRYDVIEDATAANKEKLKAKIQKYKKAGYDVHILGTNLQPHIAMKRAAKRFINKGRFVPLAVIRKKGNRINRNVVFATKLGDTYSIYDTSTKKATLMAKSNASIDDDFRNP